MTPCPLRPLPLGFRQSRVVGPPCPFPPLFPLSPLPGLRKLSQLGMGAVDASHAPRGLTSSGPLAPTLLSLASSRWPTWLAILPGIGCTRTGGILLTRRRWRSRYPRLGATAKWRRDICFSKLESAIEKRSDALGERCRLTKRFSSCVPVLIHTAPSTRSFSMLSSLTSSGFDCALTLSQRFKNRRL